MTIVQPTANAGATFQALGVTIGTVRFDLKSESYHILIG